MIHVGTWILKIEIYCPRIHLLLQQHTITIYIKKQKQNNNKFRDFVSFAYYPYSLDTNIFNGGNEGIFILFFYTVTLLLIKELIKIILSFIIAFSAVSRYLKYSRGVRGFQEEHIYLIEE